LVAIKGISIGLKTFQMKSAPLLGEPVSAPNPTSALPVRLDLDKLLRRLLPIICLGVAGNLAYSWFSTDRNAFDFSKFSMGWLLAAMLLALLPWTWHCCRLAIWGRFFGVKISWKNLLRIAVATDVGGVAMPSAIGGAPLKMTMLVQQGYSPGHAATLTLWGSIEDALFYVMAIPVSLCLTKSWDNPILSSAAHFFLEHKWKVIGLLVGAVFLGCLITAMVPKSIHRSNWVHKIQRLWQECSRAFSLIISKGRMPFVLSLLAVAAQWVTRFSILLAVVQMIGLEADFTRLLLLQWMVFVAMLFTPTPGATGGAEAAFLLVFSGSLPNGTASVTMLGWRLLTYYFILVIGVVFLFGSSRFKSDAHT